MKKILAACVAVALTGMACSSGDGVTAPTTTSGDDDRTVEIGTPGVDIDLLSALVPFDECGDFLSHVQSNAIDMVGPWGLDGGYGGPIAVLEDDAMAMDTEESAGFGDDTSADVAVPQAAASDGSRVAGEDYSTTNVQEVGVDEPDLVKTDGDRIVALSQGQLHVIDVTGRDPVLQGSTFIDGVWANEMFLVGDRVLLLSHGDSYALPATADVARVVDGYYSPTSVLVEVDISDPASPSVVHKLHLDGWYLSARMVDDVARIVVQSSPTGIAWTYPEGGGLRAERNATEANQELIRNSTVENWLPYFILEDGSGRLISEGTLVECERAYHPADFSGLNMLNVVTVDLRDGGLAGAIDATAVLADGQTVYASPENLFVGTTQWVDWRLFEDDVAPDDLPPVTTQIHQFDISDPTRTDYLASGSVLGSVLNQYSLSEHDGHLRVATTDFDSWGRGDGSVSQVSVLERQGNELVVVGEVGDLGRGERIFAVRYLGDIATVVTFRETDPLYTIDLSDPTNPQVLGELKILGYSAYLHPVGEDLVLGVGQDADERGVTQGTQVSLFDISDLANPTRKSQWTLPGGWSSAEFDARAFLHWAPTDLVVLPINVYPWGPEGEQEPFFGAVALNLDGSSISEAGRITHSTDELVRHCETWIEIDENDEEVEYEECWTDADWEAVIERSVVVGDTLFTLSPKGLLASDLDTLRPGAFVSFQG